MRKNLVTLVLGMTIMAIAGAWFGGDVLKALFPHYQVGSALGTMYNTMFPKSDEIDELLREIASDSWRQEVELGFVSLTTSGLFDLDQRYNELFRMFSINNVMRSNKNQAALSSDTSLHFGEETIVDLNLYLDREIIAFRIPQGFEYYIYSTVADLFSSNWSAIEEDADLYDWIIDNLFSSDTDSSDFGEDFLPLILRLFDDIQFYGRQTYPMPADVYRITITGDDFHQLARDIYDYISVNNYEDILPWAIVTALRDLYCQEDSPFNDMDIVIYINNGQLLGLDFSISDDETFRFIGEIRINRNNITFTAHLYDEDDELAAEFTGVFIFDTNNRLHYHLSAASIIFGDDSSVTTVTDITFTWDYNERNSDNFSFSFDSSIDITDSFSAGTIFSIDGSLLVLPEDRRIEADFGRIRTSGYMNTEISEIVDESMYGEFIFSFRYVLEADDTPIEFNRESARFYDLLTDEEQNEIEENMENLFYYWMDRIQLLISE